jgi:hypothetical protein
MPIDDDFDPFEDEDEDNLLIRLEKKREEAEPLGADHEEPAEENADVELGAEGEARTPKRARGGPRRVARRKVRPLHLPSRSSNRKNAQ